MLTYLLNKIYRRIINIALLIIKKHMGNQKNLFLYVYNREKNTLIPITWSARGITESSGKSPANQATNQWGEIDKFINYRGKPVIDVGASLGATVLGFSKDASMVYALEPHPGNYQFLLDQIRIRKIGNVKPYQMAASNTETETNFFGRESHGIHSLGEHNKGKVVDTFKVNTTTLDKFWASEIGVQVGLLKVDVEGFENEVFLGAEKLLREKKIDAIIFEFSPRIHAIRKIDVLAPIKVLNNFSYDVFHMDGTPFNPTEKLPKICDLMALPR